MWRNWIKLFSCIAMVTAYLTLLSFSSIADAAVDHKSIAANRNYRALLIGNYNYGGGNPLNGPPYDLYRLKQVLNKSRFGQGNAICSINAVENVNKIQMLNAINNTFADAAANDVSLVYYSGHGTMDETGTAALCPIDDSYISVIELENALTNIPGTKVVILDSCFSGGFINKNMASKDTMNLDINKSFNESVISAFTEKTTRSLTSYEYKVLTASSGSESAMESYTSGWGYGGEFTNSLVKGCGYINNYYPANINNDGIITLNEAYNYTKKNVINSHVQVYPDNDYSFELFRTNQVIPVTNITLDKSLISLGIGVSEQLKAYITPNNATNKDINWSSSNKLIAKVDYNGIVTGVRDGECVITAQTKEGDYIAKCSVQVIDTAAAKYREYNFSDSLVNTNVVLDKIWKIKFNKKINPLTVNNDNIYISQKGQEILLCDLQISSDGKSITLTPPVNYKPDTEYQIFLSHNIQAMDGSKLNSGVLGSFKTQSYSDYIQKPVGVVATAISSGEVNIYWEKVANADYYHIYQSLYAEGPYKGFKQNNGTLERFDWCKDYCVSIYGIEPNTKVYFKVTAVRNGVESDFSDASYAITNQDDSYQCLSIVQDGYFYTYPNTNVITAFEEFFGEPSWEYFLSTDNEHVVEFVGNCLYNGQPVTVLIQFLVNMEDRTFEVCYSEQEGVALTQSQWESLIGTIYKQYCSVQCLSIVQDGYFYTYPNTNVITAFEEFFGEPSWEYFLSTDNEHIVEFVGNCLYNGQPVTILIQFLVNMEDRTFEVCYSEQDEAALTQVQESALFAAIYGQDKSINGYTADNRDLSEQNQIIYDSLSEDIVPNGTIKITNIKRSGQDKSINGYTADNRDLSEQNQMIYDSLSEDIVPNGMIKVTNIKRK